MTHCPMTDLVKEILDGVEQWERSVPTELWEFYRKTYSPMNFILEFRTLRIGGPRQSGNSAAAAYAAKRLDAGLVVVPFVSQVESVKEAGETTCAVPVSSVRQVRNAIEKAEGAATESFGPFNSIVVDGASYLARDTELFPNLARLLDVDKGGWLVLIG